jgi:hypothetical protein
MYLGALPRRAKATAASPSLKNLFRIIFIVTALRGQFHWKDNDAVCFRFNQK